MIKTIILLPDGFEEIEALTVVDVLRRADITCDMCSMEGVNVRGSHNIQITADILFDKADFGRYDAIILPGGMPGSTNLRDNERVIEVLRKFNSSNKPICAICAAPIALERAGIVEKRCITSHPSVQDQLTACTYMEEITSEDGNIITSRGPASAIYFALHILKKLGFESNADELKKSMMLSFVEEKIKKEF